MNLKIILTLISTISNHYLNINL